MKPSPSPVIIARLKLLENVCAACRHGTGYDNLCYVLDLAIAATGKDQAIVSVTGQRLDRCRAELRHAVTNRLCHPTITSPSVNDAVMRIAHVTVIDCDQLYSV